MHKQRVGGARRPVQKSNETSSPAWQSLIGAHIALSQLLHDELSDKMAEEAEARAEAHNEQDEQDDDDEDDDDNDEGQMHEMLDMLEQQIGALDGVKKKKLPFAERMGVIGMIDELYSEMLGSIAMIDSDKDEQRGVELQVEELFATALTSTLTYCADCLSRSGGPAKSVNKLQTDSEDETLMSMKLLSTLVVNTVGESKYAESAVRTTSFAIVKLLVGIGMNENRSAPVRGTSFAVLSDVIENAPTVFSPDADGGDADIKPMVDAMLDACYSLCSDLHAVDLDDEKGANQNYGTSLLDVLATNIQPSSYIAQAILDRSSRDMQSGKDRESKGALVCLAVLPSSAPHFADTHAQSIWSVIEKGLNHATMIVRASALVAAGELAENSSVAYREYGRLVMDTAWTILDDKEQPIYIKLRACAALSQTIGHRHDHHHHDHDETCAGHHGESIVSVSEITPRVLALLGSAQTTSADDVEGWQLTEALVSVLQATVEADEDDSIDYKALIQPLLSVLAVAADSSVCNPARAVITSVIALIAEDDAKAKEIVSQYGTSIVSALKSNAPVADSDVRSATHRCWLCFASALGSDLVPHLVHIVPTITRVFSEEYTPGGAPSQIESNNDEDNDEDEEDEFDEAKMEAAETEEQQVDDERMAALALYRELLQVLGTDMLHFNDEIWSVIVQQSEDWSGSVQEQVAEIVPAFAKLHPQTNTPKFVVGESSQLSSEAEGLLQSAVKLMLSFIKFSVDPSAVAKAIDAITALTSEYGQVILAQPSTMKQFVTASKNILKGRAICQQHMQSGIPRHLRQQIEAASGLAQGGHDSDDDDDEAQLQLEMDGDDVDNDDEENDHDSESGEVVQRSLLDCLASLSKVRGPAFQSVFSELFPLLIKAGSSSSSGYAYGCMADMTGSLSLPSNPVWADEMVGEMLKALEQAVSGQNLEASRNSVYALGAVLLNGQEALSKHAKPVVAQAEKLIALCNDQLAEADKHSLEEDARRDILGARDNAASAISKALLSSSSDADLLKSALPTLLSALPIVEDSMEQSVPLSLLVKLINQKNDTVLQHKTEIIEIFNKVLNQPIADQDADIETSDSHALVCPRAVHDYVQKALDTLRA